MSTSDHETRLHLIERVLALPSDKLGALNDALSRLDQPEVAPLAAPVSIPKAKAWPHAPVHRISEQGTYIVTASTYEKQHFFRGADQLDQLEATLLQVARDSGWHLEAWAVFSNHYHFVGHSGPGSLDLKEFTKLLHGRTALAVNQHDHVTERKVWHNYWDTQLTFEKSYFARLSYVHQNPVKHGLVRAANQYKWCSAAWFERTASPAHVKTIYGFKIDKVKVRDDFLPE